MALIVTWTGRNSEDIPEDYVYKFFDQHFDRDLEDPIALIMTHSSNISLIFPIAHKWSVLLTSVFPSTVSGMRLTNSTSREKKTLTYKEQCPLKREASLNALQTAQQCWKTPIFVDESGFTTEAPEGMLMRREAFVLKIKSQAIGIDAPL